MKNRNKRTVYICLVSGVLAFAFLALIGNVSSVLAAQAKLDTAKIEQLTGVKGELNEKEGVYTVRAPRTDLQVTTAGVKMNPAMGLTSYAAFMKAGTMFEALGGSTEALKRVDPTPVAGAHADYRRRG